MKKITTEEYVAKAKQVEAHRGKNYDYSETVYTGRHSKIKIICHEKDIFGNEHGPFYQDAGSHLGGCGCPKCARPNEGITQDGFIALSQKVHEGKGYDYSQVKFVNLNTNVTIICPEHGPFKQLPRHHIDGHGCPDCAKGRAGDANRKSLEQFISEAEGVYGKGRYDFSETKYVDSKTDVYIICHEKDELGVEHGGFWIRPSNFLKGYGCKKCSNRYRPTTEEFVAEAKKVHEGKNYDYSKAVYKRKDEKVCIICPKHGEFWMTPSNHVRLGQGCPDCAREASKVTFEEFLERATAMYGDSLIFKKENFVDMSTKMLAECRVHGPFEATPSQILQGHACPYCKGWYSKSYKLSLLTENDIQQSPTDSRFFCLTGLEILSLIKAGVLPKDFLSIARTPRGSRARLEAIQTLVNDLSSDENENEEENIDTENVDVESIETLEEIERVDEEDSSDMVVDETTGLPVLDSRENVLRNGDIQGIDKLDPTSENGKFIVVNTIKKWWQVVSDDETFVDEIRNYHGSKFYDYIKEEFFKEYNAVMGMKNPEGYSLPFDLYPYQKILAHKLETRSSYSLWLDMGGGKTYSCIFASRHNHLRNNVVIAPKSVLQESWVSSLYESFPDSKVVTFFGESVDEFKVDGKKDYNKWVDSHVTVVRNIKDFTDFDGDYNYLLINYDKFSQSYAKELVERISDNYRVDYVILDETQKVKYRESTGDVSERNKHVAYLLDKIRKSNPDVKVSALTGTPLINELSEVKSIVELATGEEVSGIKNNRINIGNVSEANKALVLNGFRYRPKINVKHVLLTPEIECSEELERTIRELARQKSYYGELESALAIAKINSPEVISEIKPGTIIYVLYPYKNNTATEIIQKVESLGFKVGAYLGCTPNKHEVFDDFVNGKTDVLVASSPISVGVNGLQNRSDRMIIISLPQTNADYEQLIKRIVRKRKGGSVLEDKDVTIIVPQIVLELNENDEGDESEWSWDRSRMNALLYKKNLGDAVMDGDIQKVFRIDWNKLYRNAMKRFKDGIKDEVETKKNKVVVEEPEENTVQRQRAVSVISETHRMANSSNHGTTHQRFIDNPEAFQEYHRAREISKANWVEDPVDYLATFINEHYSNKKIADLGCGTNKLSTLMKNGNTVKGFDHQQVEGHDEVIVADIADLSAVVADREMDIAVFCLSLWGQDYQDYFKEAHRILKNNGRVIVVEPNDDFGEGKRYGDETEFINTVERYGFYRMGSVVKRNNFTYLRFIKED
jgi:superfamily II DNA or RNA helicase